MPNSRPDVLPDTLPPGTCAREGTWSVSRTVSLVALGDGAGYEGRWLKIGRSVIETFTMPSDDIDWEDLDKPYVLESMDNEALGALRGAIDNIKGWPLDKRETFAAFALMGLASRLQPVHIQSVEHQKLVTDLSLSLAELMVDK